MRPHGEEKRKLPSLRSGSQREKNSGGSAAALRTSFVAVELYSPLKDRLPPILCGSKILRSLRLATLACGYYVSSRVASGCCFAVAGTLPRSPSFPAVAYCDRRCFGPAPSGWSFRSPSALSLALSRSVPSCPLSLRSASGSVEGFVFHREHRRPECRVGLPGGLFPQGRSLPPSDGAPAAVAAGVCGSSSIGRVAVSKTAGSGSSPGGRASVLATGGVRCEYLRGDRSG